MRALPRLLLRAAVLALPPALLAGLAAADTALVLANEDFDALPRLPDGDAAAAAVDGLEDLGFEVTALADGGREDTSRALARFLADAPDAERVIVALSGRFVTDGDRSWFLTADSAVPNLFTLNSNAISLESVLAVLARRPSRAVLLIGLDPDARGAFDPWLREGLGDLDVPQGVTVLGSTPRAIAAFMEDELAEPGGDLAALVNANGAIRAEGYLPQGFGFMPDAPRPEAPVVEVPDPTTAAESALWQGAVALDTVEAYRNYLRVYPQGRYRAEARRAIQEILSEPNRAARLEEEALRLTRDQRRQIQVDLADLDFDPRGVDGIFGAGTRAAIVNWQQQAGYPQTSYLDAEQIERLSDQAAEGAARAEAERRAALAADDEYWRRTGAQGGLDGLQAYLARYPEGRHAAEAREAVAGLEAEATANADRDAWVIARETDTVRSYEAYLAAWPRGRWAENAGERRRLLLDRAEDAEGAATEGDRAEAEARAAEAALGLNPLTARVIEARLAALGLDPGEIDGTFDGSTRAALRTYQRDRELPATGYLSEPTLVRLLADTVGQALGD